MASNNLPRLIKPELIEAGDTITVTYPEDHGVQVTKTGIVAYVAPHAGMRHVITQEGGVLAVWAPGISDKLKFTLNKRPAMEQTPMFDLLEDRIA